MGSRKLLPWLVMAMVFVGLAKGDFDKDQQECSDTLIGLATCLPYVSAQAKFPTMDCCYGLKQVVQKSKRCLCILIKDRDDPKLGLKINATLALGLPDSCHTPTNITECPSKFITRSTVPIWFRLYTFCPLKIHCWPQITGFVGEDFIPFVYLDRIFGWFRLYCFCMLMYYILVYWNC